MKRTIKIFILFFICTSSVMAQQQPLFTQYAFNTLALNPGVAGTHNGVSLTGLSRFQWLGLEGAPQTNLFAAHAPIPVKNMAVGLTFMNDRVGISNENEIGAIYAYSVPFEKGTLSFGLRGNFNFFNANYSEVNTGGTNDPSFQQGDINDFKMGFGAGIYYYGERYFVGVSSPNLSKSTFVGDNGDFDYVKERVFYIMGGYVFDLNADFKVKPYANVSLSEGAPVEFDINVSLIYLDAIYLGAGYRYDDSFSLLFEWQFAKNFRFGYAADLYSQKGADELGGSGQEFMLNYLIPLKKDENNRVRYF